MSRRTMGRPVPNFVRDEGCPTGGDLLTLLPKWAGMALVAVGIALGLPGCCLWKAQSVQYHVIDYPKPPKSIEKPIPDTLMVYHFLLGDSVDLQNLIIEKAGGKGPITEHRWEENPSDMISELVLRDLEVSGLFAKTVDQWSAARYRYALEGKLNKLQGTVSNGKAEAVLEADVTLLDFETPLGAKKKVMSKTYRIRVPSVDTKPDSIARAMNLAVRRMSERIQSDIRKSLEKSEAASEGGGLWLQGTRTALPTQRSSCGQTS